MPARQESAERGFDPLLTSAWTSYATEPLLPLLHPASPARPPRTTFLTPPQIGGSTRITFAVWIRAVDLRPVARGQMTVD
jgi:hypothetical protein